MKGLLWVFFEKIGLTVLSLIATFWYANLLGPTGFGLSVVILSSALFISGIVDNIQQFPLIAAAKNTVNLNETSALGWLVISVGIAVILYVVLFSIYGSEWALVLFFAVFYIPISSLSRVYVADLIIKQHYKSLALRAFWGKAIGVTVGLFCAYLGYVELAIILQSLVAVFIALIVMMLSNTNLLKAGKKFDSPLFFSMLREGVPSGVTVIEQSIKGHGLIVLLGIFSGAQISGLYALAIKFVDIPRTIIGFGFSTWATGKFHNFRAEPAKLNNFFNAAMLACSAILIPAYIGLITVSDTLVIQFFGADWLDAASIIVWLAFYYCVLSLYVFLPALLVLFKTTYNTLMVNLFSTAAVVLSVVFLSDYYGQYAPLVGMYFSLLFLVPKYTVEMLRALDTSFESFYQLFSGVITSALVMFTIVSVYKINFLSHNLYQLIAIGVIAYIVTFLMLIVVNIIDRNLLTTIKKL
ncbi:MAG: oligosaccharide flippase family protein [Pseudoalteromonas distincta]|uniref:oligosaccharide flippase family protein n=1 Tax=Pseudoalteromonas distincta TaxID=77608 RepID=UPI003002A25B